MAYRTRRRHVRDASIRSLEISDVIDALITMAAGELGQDRAVFVTRIICDGIISAARQAGMARYRDDCGKAAAALRPSPERADYRAEDYSFYHRAVELRP